MKIIPLEPDQERYTLQLSESTSLSIPHDKLKDLYEQLKNIFEVKDEN